MKVDADGNLAWTVSATSTNESKAQSVADIKVDSRGNVCCVGIFDAAIDFDPGPDQFNLVSHGENSDAFVAKFHNEGDFAWTIHIGGSENGEEGSGVVLDPASDIYVGAATHGGTLIQFQK